ncbi:BRO1-domain-containing protein [Gymnopus androsaceus JB14]|uniref:BRO domain-containing protein 1 n=1 Tax=Gymnopus androsaceus JB14 TaxID=1447944 RepID=A0A6A4IKM7_9AGAR|nr:BRO1-domain-containing protein [Gymnopus androsaceus JB14]
MIFIPRKSTDDFDRNSPSRTLISQSYGENSDAECASLHRCMQDAVKGAGCDSTAVDLLYRYFGQLELLELRLSEIRATFTSCTVKLTSIASEKASILYQIASAYSAMTQKEDISLRHENTGSLFTCHESMRFLL